MAVFYPTIVSGQPPSPPGCLLADPLIMGSYTGNLDHYQLGLYIYFAVPANDQWINQQEAEASAALTIQLLNDAFNPYSISFRGLGTPCSQPTVELIPTSLTSAQALRNAGYKHSDGIDIYVFKGSVGPPTGWAFGAPNTYLTVRGSENGLRANETAVVIHEMGHALGLLHVHEDKCNLTIGCGGTGNCYCTGDYVCDTPPTDTLGLDCTSTLGRNYMSAADLYDCWDNFTAEQVLRMRVHLANHNILQNVIIPPLEFPGSSLPSAPSSDIVVSSGELHITSTLEMLPGASIWVKPGATLRVSAKITGACGKLWKGIILEGKDTAPQVPAAQGRVIVNSNGIIEHAECGIQAYVAEVDGDGDVVDGTEGGIINVSGGKFLNNIIGIRYGPFTPPNVSYIHFGDFYTDEDYRAEDIPPTHLELTRVSEFPIKACEFKDFRTTCVDESARAVGICSFNAGFDAGSLCRFENLYYGILASNTTAVAGSFTVRNNQFKACQVGIKTVSTSDFSIEDNDFYVRLPDGCEENEDELEAIGVELTGTTAGFSLRDNFFHYDEEDIPDYNLIGVSCMNLREGMNNEIRNNVYENMLIAHKAIGDNGLSGDGLVYLCDSATVNYPSIPVVIKDFLVTTGGTIREDQEDVSDDNQRLPTGNAFSGQGFSFQNLGLTVNYLYYDGINSQDPDNSALDPVGINPEATDGINTNCFTESIPCTPPCDKEVVVRVKEDFHDTKALWEEQKAAYPLIEEEEEQQIALDSIARLRRAMNRHARLILMTYSLDTVAIQADSILTWLALVETYSTDYRLTRHFFFTGEFTKFDALWAAIPERYALDEAQLAEIDEIETVLSTIRPELEANLAALRRLPEAILDSLMYWQDDCAEPGALAQAVLWRNGRRVYPDCGGEESSSRPGKGQQSPVIPLETAKPRPVKVYPNPSQGTLTIELPIGYGPSIAVFYSLQGKALLKRNLTEGRTLIRLPHFQPGVYMLELTPTSGQREHFKLILTQ